MPTTGTVTRMISSFIREAREPREETHHTTAQHTINLETLSRRT